MHFLLSKGRLITALFYFAVRFMKQLNNGFYQSKAWEKCRAAYIKRVGGLCELCKAKGLYRAGKIVHHKVYLTEDNCSDPSIALNFDNLILVCHQCHEDIHKSKKRFYFDANGNIISRDTPPIS